MRINTSAVLLSLVIALVGLQILWDASSYFSGHWTPARFVFPFVTAVLGAGAWIYILKMRGRFGYGLISLLAFGEIIGSTTMLYQYAPYVGMYGIQPAITVAGANILYLTLKLVVALPVLIISFPRFLDCRRQEKRVRAMTESELIKDHITSSIIYQHYKDAKERKQLKAAREATRKAGWDRYELRRRDQLLFKLIEDLGCTDESKRQAALNEIYKKFGEEPIQALHVDWKVPQF